MSNAMLLTDGYKLDHRRQYPNGTEFVYANWTPRSNEHLPEAKDGCVVFGIQYFIKKYLIEAMNKDFFAVDEETAVKSFKRRIDTFLGENSVGTEHIRALHRLGYMPLRIKSLPEGSICPIRVPMLTVMNTNPDFFWLTNFIETLMSCELWLPMTSATTARLYRKEPVVVKCRITNGDDLFLLMQLSDILNRQCIEVCILEIYYLMGMRCDRLFDIDRPFTLSIVADVINSLKAGTVYVYESHSSRCLRMIQNGFDTHLAWYIKCRLFEQNKELLLVAPDKGSVNRYRNKHFAVVCDKVRNEATGELQGFRATPKEDVAGRDLLVIDDLCDGGGTFVGLAPKLRELNPNTMSLLVTHAIQKQGVEKVAAVYDKVYITDTYKDWTKESLPANVTVFKVDELNAI